MPGDGSKSHATPDVEATVRAVQSPRSRSLASTVTAIVAVFAALYVAKGFFIPVAVAIVLNLVLSPIVRRLERLHLPAPAGAALVLLVGLGLLGAGAYELAGPLHRWVGEAPQTIATIARKLRVVTQPLQRVGDAANQVEEGAAPDRKQSPAPAPTPPAPGGLNWESRLLVTGGAFVGGASIALILLFFLLAVGDLFRDKLIDMLPRGADRQKALSLARTLESAISTYLLLLTAINVGEGLVIAAMTAVIGLPDPWLWGAVVAAAQFVPVLGTFVVLAVLMVAGVATFDSFPHALLAPAGYAAVDFVQANFVTPIVMSKRLRLNPVAVLIALALWGWLWGVPGFLLAVPLLAMFKVCCDHVDSLASIGALLGDARRSRRLRDAR